MKDVKDRHCPLISVLIPAYNHEKYIGACIRSVMAQDWPRMELVIVDDGSSDGTWKAIQILGKEARKSGRFERVEAATQVNVGTCVTLNRLCEMARGDVIAEIASDDMYLPGAFSALMRPLLEDESVGVVVGQNELMDGDGRTCLWDEDRNVCYDETGRHYATFNQYLEWRTGIVGHSERFGRYEAFLETNHVANGFLVRRSYLDCVLPYQREAPLEDLWLHLQLSKICKYCSIDTHTFRYRWHTTNTAKQTKRMSVATAKTLQWEYDHVMALGEAHWIEAVKKAAHSDKKMFSLFGLIEVHRVQDFKTSRRFLQIGKRRFMYHQRRFF